jgi:hypothetical protein
MVTPAPEGMLMPEVGMPVPAKATRNSTIVNPHCFLKIGSFFPSAQAQGEM